MTYAAPQVTTMTGGSMAYAAPQVTTMTAGIMAYMTQPSATMMPAAGSVTYAASPTATMIQPMTYGAPTMTYAAPSTYAAPVSGQPVYTISPERFQLIMAGQPLTNEEIMAMTGQAPAGAPALGTQMGGSMVMPTQSQAGASFAMPDMFATPGLTNVFPSTAASTAASTAFEPAASTAMSSTSAVVQAPAPVVSASSKKKSSSKKSSKKKLS